MVREPHSGPDAHAETRWRGRPILAACVRLLVFTAPIGASVGTAALVSRAVGPAHTKAEFAWQLALILGSSTVVLFAADRIARRLLPLSVLLKLSLAFPGEAPSRLRLARCAGSTKDLEARIQRARVHGIDDEPARAAEQILALVAAVEAHDRATRGHSERVRMYTDLLAEEMGLPARDRDRLRWAAMLHDVGKLEVPAAILNKPAKLEPHEWELVRVHPEEGAKLIRPLRGWLGQWAAVVEQHHERWDGDGYPRRLRGEEISIGARMVSVTDAYETMTARRPYRRTTTPGKAREELVRCSGSHFDPHVVRAFLRISVRRVGIVSGPLSWLAQSPFIHGIEQVTAAAGRAAASAAVAGGTVALAVAPVPPKAPVQVVERAAARPIALPSSVSLSGPPLVTVSPMPTPTPSPTPAISPSVKPTPRISPKPIISPSPWKSPTVRASPSPSPSDSDTADVSTASWGGGTSPISDEG